MDYHKEQTEQVSWNLSEALIQELSLLLQQSSNYYIGRYYNKCFDCLKAIKLRVIQSLNKEERNEFTNKEIIILDRISLDTCEKYLHKKKMAWLQNRNKLSTCIDSYNNLLMDTLQKYGYLIKKQEDVKKMF